MSETSRQERLPALPSFFLSDYGTPTRKVLDVNGCVVVTLGDLLSKEECCWMRECAVGFGLEDVCYEYDVRYRECERTLTWSQDLANLLWKRMRDALSMEDLVDIKPFGHGTGGYWVPEGVNPLFRIVKYGVGGHFNLHRDGGFVLTSDRRSAMTLLVYLNDHSEFEGGSTRFVGVDNETAVDMEAQRGTAVLFNHDTLHAGQPVTEGAKYILRTDIMFVRIHKNDACFENDNDFIRSLRLYDESIALQKAGCPAESTSAFLEAMEIQARAFSSMRDKNSHAPDFISLDCWRQIISYLNVRETLALGAVSKSMLKISRDSAAWKKKYHAIFDEVAQVQKTEDFGFYHLFRYRWLCERYWDCFCVDLSSNFIRAGVLSVPISSAVSSPGVIGRVMGHYWSCHSAFHDYMIGYDILENNSREYGYNLYPLSILIPSQSSGTPLEERDDFIYLSDRYTRYPISHNEPFSTIAALLLTSFMQRPFLTYSGRLQIENMYHPLAVAIPPFVDNNGKQEFMKLVARDCSGLCFEAAFDSSELLAHYHHLPIAVVIIVADTYISCTKIVGGKNSSTSFSIYKNESLENRFSEKVKDDVVLKELSLFFSNNKSLISHDHPVILGGLGCTPAVVECLKTTYFPRVILTDPQFGILKALRDFCSRKQSLAEFHTSASVISNIWDRPKLQLQNEVLKFSVDSPLGITDETSVQLSSNRRKWSSQLSALLTYILERRSDVLSYFPFGQAGATDAVVRAALQSVREPKAPHCSVFFHAPCDHRMLPVFRRLAARAACSIGIFGTRWGTQDPVDNPTFQADIVAMFRDWDEDQYDIKCLSSVKLYVLCLVGNSYNRDTREARAKKVAATLPQSCQRWIISGDPDIKNTSYADFFVSGKPRFFMSELKRGKQE